ncbi:MAG: hypothetical protein U0931_19955 [Vulcanimicrobiota bacterium]
MRIVLCLCLSLPVLASPPRDWRVFTSRPQTYLASREPGYQGKYSASLASTVQANQSTYALYVQDIDAARFRGCRIRLSGWLRTRLEGGWAGLWLRADPGKGPPLAFENMQSNGLKGVQSWRRVQFEIDIPAQTQSLHYGALINGLGQIWADDLKLEVIAQAPPGLAEMRRLRILDEPSNLGFEQ